MARSSDPRKPTRYQRGAKRYHDVGGHVPPGDEVENTRDHERIWFELRRHRNCCDCDDPGFKYCFQTFDWPQYICDGEFPGGDTLLGYWPIEVEHDSSWFFPPGCVGGEVRSYNLGVPTAHPAGSWRNGPYSDFNGWMANWILAGITWSDFFPAANRTFEAWIKPSAADIASGARFIVGTEVGVPLSSGGVEVYFRSDGSLAFQHIQVEGGALQQSPPGWWEAEQWHHFVMVRNADTNSIAFFINGKLVISRRLPSTGWSIGTFPASPKFITQSASWSDAAYYSSALSAAVIRKHYLSVYGVEGVANPLNDEGVTIEDPTTIITEEIHISQIGGGGPTQVGSIVISQGDFADYVTPEDSPFELEERKDTADGYAGLDADARLPLAKIGHLGTPSDLSFLRGDRRWVPGTVVDRATAPGQILVAGGGGLPDDYVALLSSYAPRHYWKMTEAGSPPATIDNVGSAAQDFTSQGNPAANSDDPRLFLEETSLRMDGTGDYWTGPTFFPGGENFVWAGSAWIYLEEIPSSEKQIFYQGGTFQWGFSIQATGILRHWHGYSSSMGIVGTTPLTPGVWHHVAFERTAAGNCRIYLDGVLEVSGGGHNYYTFGGSAQIGEAGLMGRIGHAAIHYGSDLPAGWAAALYAERSLRWNPTSPDDLGIGGAGSSLEVDQTAHGFSEGDVLYFDGTEYALALADDPDTAEVVGIVSEVAGANSFTLLSGGYLNTLSGLTPGDTYFLSDSTPGLLTTSEPGGPGEISKPLFVAVSATGGFFHNHRGLANPGGGGGSGITGLDVSAEGVVETADPRPELNFIAGTDIGITVTDDVANDKVDVEIEYTGAGGGGGGGDPYEGREQDKPPSSAHAADDEFDGASLDVKWTWQNQGTSVATVDAGYLSLAGQVTGSSSESQRVIEQDAPAGDFTVTIKVDPSFRQENFSKFGIVLRRSSDSRLILFGRNASGSTNGAGGYRFNSPTGGYSATLGTDDSVLWNYYRIRKVGTNLLLEKSMGGRSWVLHATEAIASWIGTVNKVGLFVGNCGSVQFPAAFEWFRVEE